MPHVISDIVLVERDGEELRIPRVAHLLECPFATSDGRFELPPEVQGRVDAGYVVVALTDEDAAAAISLGYTPVVSLDPCEVSA